MRTQTIKTGFALGLVAALLGCTVPVASQLGSPSLESGASRGTLPEGVGAVGLAIRWPDAQPTLQAIPNRAVKAVVTLTRADGSPALDASGKAIAPAEIYRQQDPYYYGPYAPGFDTYRAFSWELPAQAGLRIRAEVRDESNQVVASDAKQIDVVPGVYAYLGMELTAVDAPAIASLSKSDWRVGDRIVVTGSGFGKSKGWKTYAYLGINRTYDNVFSSIFPQPAPPTYYGGMRMMIPESAVTVDSDTEVTLTVPESVISSLGEYFRYPDKTSLTFSVMVDGVTSRSVDISMPREAASAVRVDLTEAGHAPAQAATRSIYQALWEPPFSVPMAAGTRWTYRVTNSTTYPGNGYSSTSSRTLHVELLNDNRQARYHSTYPYAGAPTYTNETNLNWGYSSDLAPLFRIQSVNGLQTLADVAVSVPSVGLRLAKRYVVSPESSMTTEVWLVDGVGVVRSVETRVGGYRAYPENYQEPYTRQRNVTTYDLIEFSPGAGSAER